MGSQQSNHFAYQSERLTWDDGRGREEMTDKSYITVHIDNIVPSLRLLVPSYYIEVHVNTMSQHSGLTMLCLELGTAGYSNTS